MKTLVHLWQCLVRFFLEWEMFETKIVQKIKTHILRPITLFRKSCRLWDNVEKYSTARQATDGNIIRRMGIAYWITEATDTHSQHVILIVFPLQQWLHERAPVLRSYVHCLSCIVGFFPPNNIKKDNTEEKWPVHIEQMGEMIDTPLNVT